MSIRASEIEEWPRKVGIEWDLSAMAPGSRAVSSFGEGNTSATLDAQTLGMGYFMAGPWQRLAPGGDQGFLTYYLTPPDFDLSSAVEDVTLTYRHAAALFGTEPQPFRAFMRTTDRFQGGGTGGRESFMFGTVKGAARTADELNNLLTHEALHNWIGSLQTGPEGLWFVEGATNCYTAILPFRAGRRSTAQVAAQIGEWTSNYYANPRRLMGDDEAAAAFWSDTDAQLLPYAYTRDLGRAFRLSRDIEAGMVIMNSGSVGTASVPFGGVKHSGYGREGSYYGIEEYIEVKYVLMGGLDK